MAGLKLTSIGLIMVVISVNTWSPVEKYVFCPYHTQSINLENKIYRACEPYLCIPQDPDDSQSQYVCPDENRNQQFLDKMLSPSCHWVRLHRGYSYDFNSSDAGSIYEIGTNITHEMGDYVYNPDLQEAFICRETLQPQDDTEDITLWCTSHTIYMADYPTELLNENGNHDLHLPQINLTVHPDFYAIHPDQRGYKVNLCSKTSLEFIRCESKLTLRHSETEFELLSNLSLLVNWMKPIAYPVGQYYLSADHESAIVCVTPDKIPSRFQYYTYILFTVSADIYGLFF